MHLDTSTRRSPDWSSRDSSDPSCCGATAWHRGISVYVLSRDDEWHVHPGTEDMHFVADDLWLLLLTGVIGTKWFVPIISSIGTSVASEWENGGLTMSFNPEIT